MQMLHLSHASNVKNKQTKSHATSYFNKSISMYFKEYKKARNDNHDQAGCIAIYNLVIKLMFSFIPCFVAEIDPHNSILPLVQPEGSATQVKSRTLRLKSCEILRNLEIFKPCISYFSDYL